MTFAHKRFLQLLLCGGALGACSDGGHDSTRPDAGDELETPEQDASMPEDPEGDAGDMGEEPAESVAPTGPRELEPLVCAGPGPVFATAIYDYGFGPGQNFGQADLRRVLGPPLGAGCCSGSLDVVSLGNGGYIVLEFEGNAIVDGPGPDFIVFENVFGLGNNPMNPNAELSSVAVSEDGTTWFEFPCTATKAPAPGCAGWQPIYANPQSNDISPTDPEVAGGDAFDLADIGVTRARLVRITDRGDIAGTVFDLDAVSIVHGECL